MRCGDGRSLRRERARWARWAWCLKPFGAERVRNRPSGRVHRQVCARSVRKITCSGASASDSLGGKELAVDLILTNVERVQLCATQNIQVDDGHRTSS